MNKKQQAWFWIGRFLVFCAAVGPAYVVIKTIERAFLATVLAGLIFALADAVYAIVWGVWLRLKATDDPDVAKEVLRFLAIKASAAIGGLVLGIWLGLPVWAIILLPGGLWYLAHFAYLRIDDWLSRRRLVKALTPLARAMFPFQGEKKPEQGSGKD